MIRFASAAVLAAAGLFLAAGAQAQVYRCGDSKVYTDKPCAGATAVDLRPNMMDAGPRHVPAEPPQPAIILPDMSRVQTQPEPPGGTVWDRRDSRAAEHRNRTGPF